MQDVAYGSDPVRSILDEILSLPFDELDHYGYESRLRYTLRRLSGIKHEAFADEREVRLVVQDNFHLPHSDIRVSASGALVAYRKVVFPSEAVRSITMLPGGPMRRGLVAC